MFEAVYDPVEKYKKEYQSLFKQNLVSFFDELVKNTNTDVEKNQKLCKDIYLHEEQVASLNSRRGLYVTLLVICILLCIAGAGSYFYIEDRNLVYFLSAGAVAMLFICIFPLRRKLKELGSLINDLRERIDELKADAYETLSELICEIGWDSTLALIEKTVPALEFDKFFSRERFNELVNDFGPIPDLDTPDSSIIGLQSGHINGNPFAFVRRLVHFMGAKTYTGYKTITWTERVPGPNGKSQTVTRSQVLSASITKPFPDYTEESYFVYANSAAPSLTFDRAPKSFNNEDGFFSRRKLKRTTRRLEKFSRNLEDDSNYTMMTNKEFETRFETSNRDNETEYRVLFTPLAQKQMLALLTEKEVGYGDDFYFLKRKMINLIKPNHIQLEDLNVNSSNFLEFDFKKLEEKFKSYSEEFFKKIYFSMAPVLCIPAYQHTRSARTIWGEEYMPRSMDWEWELQANLLNSQKGCFEHSSADTQSIIKTVLLSDNQEEKEISIIASSFKGENKVHYESVWGLDGRYHRVPIEWVLYTPVRKTTNVIFDDKKPRYNTIKL